MPDRHEQRYMKAKAAGTLSGRDPDKQKPGRFPLEGGTAITLPPHMDSKPTVNNKEEEDLRARMTTLTEKIGQDPTNQAVVEECDRLRRLLRDFEKNRNKD